MKLRKAAAFVCALIIALGCMSVTSSADNSAYIAPEGDDALFESSKAVVQSYTFNQLGSPSYTGVTRVKLEWEVSDIDVTYSSSKTWNPRTLTWDETKTVASVPDKTATFTLMNYSSEKVVGSVGFAVDADLAATLSSATFDENNGKTMDAAESGTPSVNVITATLKFNAAAFSDLAATNSYTKYGTYTVSIASVPKESYNITCGIKNSNGFMSSSLFNVSSNTIEEGETATITIAFKNTYGYFVSDDTVTVVNATKVSWTIDENDDRISTLTITGATGDVTVTITLQSRCFVAGTKISMADGTVKNIEDITAGDLVKAYDVVNGEFYTTSVNKVYRSSNTVISTITLSDGTQIQCTPNHPICTTDGFRSVDPDFAGGLREYPSEKLNVGDTVVTDHGTFAVSSIETNIGELVPVFNLSVESNGSELNNTFVANGVVAHNKAG